MLPARRVLVSTYEVPGFGGAASSSYDLFRKLLGDGVDASYLCFIQERDRPFFEFTFGAGLGNPAGLPGAAVYGYSGSGRGPEPELAVLLARLAPEVMVALTHVPVPLLKRAAPQVPLVLFTAGCVEAQAHVGPRRLAADAIALEGALQRRGGPWRIWAAQEQEAIEHADLVITHAPMIRQFIQGFYGTWAGKLYPRVIWMAEWIVEGALRHADLARPFEQRGIDLLFVASTWDRQEKNYPLVRAIAKQLAGAAIHVVGDVPQRIPGVSHHGFLADRASLFALFGNARTVVCPSRLDAAPGILFEASALGANVVASRNCGNWALCHDELLAEPYGRDAFVRCCARSLERKFPDHLAQFLSPSSYEDLVETLMVV